MTVRIVQLSDTHLAATGTPAAQLARAQLERAVAQAATLEPDLVLLTGDLTDDGSLDATVEVARIAGRPGVPVLAVAGNHDDRAVVAATFGGAGMARLGRWTVLTAATAVPGHEHGAIDVDATLARIDALADGPIVLALHHPPVGTSSNPIFQLSGGAELTAGLLSRPNVRAVVSGHLHEGFNLRVGHLDLLGAPSTYFALRHHGGEFTFVDDGLVGFQVIDLDDDSVTWRGVPCQAD